MRLLRDPIAATCLLLAVGVFVFAVVWSVGTDEARRVGEEARPVGPVGEEVIALEEVGDLAALDGRVVAADGARVQSMPADEAFWVSAGSRRVWVRITTAWESPFVVEPGDRVSFTGEVVGHAPDYADRPGFSPSDAEALEEAGGHIEVDVRNLRLDH
jgi:hypothetical protein